MDLELVKTWAAMVVDDPGNNNVNFVPTAVQKLMSPVPSQQPGATAFAAPPFGLQQFHGQSFYSPPARKGKSAALPVAFSPFAQPYAPPMNPYAPSPLSPVYGGQPAYAGFPGYPGYPGYPSPPQQQQAEATVKLRVKGSPLFSEDFCTKQPWSLTVGAVLSNIASQRNANAAHIGLRRADQSDILDVNMALEDIPDRSDQKASMPDTLLLQLVDLSRSFVITHNDTSATWQVPLASLPKLTVKGLLARVQRTWPEVTRLSDAGFALDENLQGADIPTTLDADD